MTNFIEEIKKDVENHINESREFTSTNAEDVAMLTSSFQIASNDKEVHIFTHKSNAKINGEEEEVIFIFPDIQALILKVACIFRKKDKNIYFLQKENGNIILVHKLLATMFATSITCREEIEKEMGGKNTSPMIAKIMEVGEFFNALRDKMCRK